jgi:hypothetical protein
MARKKKIDSNKPNKIVKKRKVGRPKKRGRKKKYYTSKKKSSKVAKKGFSSNVTYNRVRAILWNNFKDDFPSYRSFISNDTDEQGNKIKGTSIVSKVFSQCKDLDCLDQDIIEIYLQFQNQNSNDDKPILPDDYYDTHYYWELETEDWWAGFDNRVWVVSPMLLTEPDNFLGILGSDKYVDRNGNLIKRKFNPDLGDYIIRGKSARFKEFINFCNSLQREGLVNSSSDVPNWRFVGKEDDEAEVYWNPLLKRWEVRIIICDPFGNVENYGFDPIEPDSDIDSDLILNIVGRTPIEEVPVEETPIEEPRRAGLSKEEIEIRKKELEQEDVRLELEKERSKRIDKLLQKFMDDKIDSDTFERLLKLI